MNNSVTTELYEMNLVIDNIRNDECARYKCTVYAGRGEKKCLVQGERQ
jgi:hypothetical protein